MQKEIEIIKNRTFQANLSLLADNIQPHDVKHKIVEEQSYEFWKKELKSSALGYKTGVQTLLQHPEAFNHLDQIILQDCLLSPTDLEIFNDSQLFCEVLSGSLCLQEKWNKHRQVLLAFYCAFELLFRSGKWLDGLNVCSFLILMNPGIAGFWIGKGSVNEMLQHWVEALDNYWKAQSLNNEDCHIYSRILRVAKLLDDHESIEKSLLLMEKYQEAV